MPLLGQAERMIQLVIFGPTAAARPALRLGGEWAGWCCAFSPTSAAVQKIDEKFVPESLLAYDQIPRGFEELVTEDDSCRRTVRLMPVGSG